MFNVTLRSLPMSAFSGPRKRCAKATKTVAKREKKAKVRK